MSKEQAEALRKAVAPRLAWMGKLCDRMDRLGIDPSDPILLAAREAHSALHSLHILCHYRSCQSGVGVSASPGSFHEPAPRQFRAPDAPA